MTFKCSLLSKIAFIAFIAILSLPNISKAQGDTTWVQTLTFDSTGRSYFFDFPEGDHNQYQKIVMEYRMRCKNALVSTGADRNKGCGEWDYSCNTFITDTSSVDSAVAGYKSHTIPGFSAATFPYTNAQTYNLIELNKKDVSYSDTTSETIYSLNLGVNSVKTLNQGGQANKIQLLYTLTELQNAGLSASALSGIKLNALKIDGELKNFKIKIKPTTKNILDPGSVDMDGFTEVFFNDVAPKLGENFFRFYTNFDWDGLSNIILEISYDNANNNTVIAGSTAADSKSLVSSEYGYSSFSGAGNLSLDEVDFSSINNEVSFSFWTKGNPDFLGSNNSTIFEGVDDDNIRQANVHLPWSNKNVYWDCGNDGSGYDRINKLANLEDYAGQWNHWAFVKNATTGQLTMFLNGSEWVGAVGKIKTVDIKRFVLGTSITGNPVYSGDIDDFAVWDKALTIGEVQRAMAGDPTLYSDLSANLVSRLRSGADGVTDISSAQAIINKNDIVGHKDHFARDVFKGFSLANARPSIDFVVGEYTLSTASNTTYDTLFQSAFIIKENKVENGEVVSTIIDEKHLATAGIIFNENGDKIDEIAFDTAGTIEIEDLNYYRYIDKKVEIMSFVTPYGINLDFGVNGEMWEFNLTDFGPVLKGNKRLSLEFGGQNQEQMDIRFGFIKGTPVRDVLAFHQIWPVSSTNYQNIQADNAFEPRTINLEEGTKSYKYRSVITGHGQEGEFIPRNHTYTVNGKNISRRISTECSFNPIQPQGGTWIYDRAGWCPGAPSDLVEYEFTNEDGAANPVTLDYTVTSGSGDSRYIVNNQLVVYGAPNFATDARITEISRPNNGSRYKKLNPSCENPLITVENTGSNEITSIKINFWVGNDSKSEYIWEGSINFLEKVSIELPTGMSFWKEGASTFNAQITEVNGAADENPSNDLSTSKFDPFARLSGNLELRFRSNTAYTENRFTIANATGEEFLAKTPVDFSANTNHTYTMNLEEGCYIMDFEDRMVGSYGQNGLSFFAASQFGSGSLLLRDLDNSNLTTNFNPDFGGGIYYVFGVGSPTVGVNENLTSSIFNIYPNPSSGIINIDFYEPSSKEITFTVLNAVGKVVYNETINNSKNGIQTIISLENKPKGVYLLQIRSRNDLHTKKIIID